MSEAGKIQINKYLPFACIYFFFNSLFLPEGLLYIYVLTPFFLLNIAENKRLKYLLITVLISLLFLILHVINGVNLAYYLRSYILLIAVVIFCIWFYGFSRKIKSLETLMLNVLSINAFFVVLALISLKLNILKDYFWYLIPISPGIPVVPRLKMFTYEASYYSLLLVPFAFFVIWKLLLQNNKMNWWHLLLVVVPLGLSFSLGVLGGIIISLAVVILINFNAVIANKRVVIIGIIGLIVLAGGLYFSYRYFPDNPLIQRLKNIQQGKDTSAKGRTLESFDLALKIAKEKSVWIGVGLGQIKEIGKTIILQYYEYKNATSVPRIPNAVGETFAIYGIIGLILRFLLITYLFFKTRVFSNYYRLSLFVFIFIYQFTGSYILNIVEFVIWILAFSPVFPQFNRTTLKTNE